MSHQAEKLFFDKQRSWEAAEKLLNDSFKTVGSQFESQEAHNTFFRYIFTPKSKSWAYVPCGKAGTNTVLAILFEIEFGVSLKTTFVTPENLSSEAMHQTINAGVFRALHLRSDIDSFASYFENAIKIAMVRNPTTRAWSSFRYLCKSNDVGSPQFVKERIRLTASVRFDWERDPYTKVGFAKFLDYVELSLTNGSSGYNLDGHWRPQWYDVRPDFFRPSIVGKMEDIEEFEERLRQAFGAQPKRCRASLNANTERSSLPEWFMEPDIRQRLVVVYGRDYEEFGYDL
ncbi:MAG: sulfotransferase family 2 domain-containing protein [Gammaproteobacteria bacterium]|nr:sulfotransferase family 2 domain-containing protein [Gammaproteobacteria bacterium]